MLDNFLEITSVAHAFKGIKVAVGILIVDAAIKMFKKIDKSITSIIITILAFLALLVFNVFSIKISSIIILIAAAIISLSVFLIGKVRKAGSNK